MKVNGYILLIAAAVMSGCAAKPGKVIMKNFYDIEVQKISGETIKLEQYKGKVLLIVNTASKCGFTGQYEGPQELYLSNKDKNFVVLGFPSNDFLRQEPGSNNDIKAFCKLNYGVTFPMFAKISVKGKDQHPLYTWLTSKEINPELGGKIRWNFNKFLISHDGKVVSRFGSRTKPDDEKLVAAIQTALSKCGQPE